MHKLETPVKIAVYGTLKKGHGNHFFLESSTFIGNTKTEPIYNFYSLGGFPAITKNGKTPIPLEIYEVSDTSILQSIDSLEGYNKFSSNNFYDKEEIETEFGTCQIYIFSDESFRSFKKQLTPITTW